MHILKTYTLISFDTCYICQRLLPWPSYQIFPSHPKVSSWPYVIPLPSMPPTQPRSSDIHWSFCYYSLHVPGLKKKKKNGTIQYIPFWGLVSFTQHNYGEIHLCYSVHPNAYSFLLLSNISAYVCSTKVYPFPKWGTFGFPSWQLWIKLL